MQEKEEKQKSRKIGEKQKVVMLGSCAQQQSWPRRRPDRASQLSSQSLPLKEECLQVLLKSGD